jgi:bacillithiol system protein YtxJ
MSDRQLTLDQDPAVALAALLELSRERPVVVFKKSPTCPVSHRAEWEFRNWVKKLAPDDPVRTAVVDVLAERSLARGLTEALDLQHESPQALWFEAGALKWHGSHGALTEARFVELTAEHARRDS